jgi:hypothetical protein
MKLEAIEEANLEEAVATLSRGFPGRRASFWRESVTRLTAYRRATAGPPIGRLMKVEGRPVGVILTIASRRRSGGRAYDVVNLSSWYVEERYRWLAPRMLEHIVSDDGVVFTDLSPSPQTARINERLGFRTAAEGLRLYFLPWTAIGSRSAARMVELEHVPAGALAAHERELLARHRELGCIAAALHLGRSYYAFLFRPTWRRGMPAALLLFAPSRRIVSEQRSAIARFLLGRGLVFLIFHGDMSQASSDGAFLWNRSAAVQVKGEWESDRIDHTYSELVFLRL